MSGSIMEPQEKMRGRDVNKVARGEQAPRPLQQTPNVSTPPPPRCTKDGGKDCEKFAKYYRSQCPSEWIEMWNKQRERGAFPSPV